MPDPKRAAGQQTGNRTNAGLTHYPAVWSTHLHSYAAASRIDYTGSKVGRPSHFGISLDVSATPEVRTSSKRTKRAGYRRSHINGDC